MNPPKRAFDLVIHCGANTWEDLVHELDRVAKHVIEHGPECNAVSGSPSAGSSVDILLDPMMTKERYFQELDAYLEEVNGKKTEV
jgi:hypothetical protein